jgi:BON domain
MNYRNPQDREREDREREDRQRRDWERWRGQRWQSGSDRDRYETGDESRYQSDRDEESAGRGWEGQRRYSSGGYPEEFGYRSGQQHERERWQGQRGGPGFGEDESWRGSDYQRGGFRGQRSGGWGESRWGEESESPYGAQESGSGSQGGYRSQGGGFRGEYFREQQRYGQRQGQQSYQGRGPKGYERSDERLKELICERLTDDPRIDASDVTVEVSQRVVKLRGTVDDRRTKYEIEELVERCGGVRDIDNQLRTQSASEWERSQQSRGSETSSQSGASQAGASSPGSTQGSTQTGGSTSGGRSTSGTSRT